MINKQRIIERLSQAAVRQGLLMCDHLEPAMQHGHLSCFGLSLAERPEVTWAEDVSELF